ncbi:MAG: MtrB/PioB family outer membrane beta-barrel protein [Candidatus Magnetominusculus sp. LBB02]|nr:MtrB/PioB family outer membrane beta-barrel protein [Candidatus Magnetominusculus sp. LBB02]
MKANIAVFIAFLMLLPLGMAFAEDTTTDSAAGICGDDCILKIPNLSGEVTLSGLLRPVQGNSTKYNEYRDDNRGNVFGDIKLKYDNDNVWLYLKASDIGYDTQRYSLEGGVYGIVKFYLRYDEMPHNYSLGDKTIYNGVGSNNLTLMPGYSKLPSSSWNSIDYSIKRQNEGGGFRLDAAKPFYVQFDANREERTGTRPISLTNSNSSSGPITEIPQPIAYTTSLFRGEMGYLTKPLFVSAFAQLTDFSDANQAMYFQNVYTAAGSTTISSRAGQMDAMSLPPSNQSYNYGLKASAALPLNSRLNMSMSNTQTTSDSSYWASSLIGTTNAIPNPKYTYTYANGSDWRGRVDTQNYSVVLNTNPIPNLSANIFYKYRGLENKSDNPSATSSTGNTNPYVPAAYYKNNAGADVSYKLPAHFILSAGYNYVVTNNSVSLNTTNSNGSEQMTYDIPRTTDNIYNVALKWAGVDFMSAKAGYERMNRSGANDSNINMAADTYAWFKNEFDIGSQKRDKIKTNVDFFPLENLDVGLGYNYKRSVYPDTEIGLRNSKTNEYYVDAGYTFGKYVRLSGYAAYEDYSTYQFFRQSTSGNTDPNSTTQNATNYNFDLTIKDRSLDYGVGLDIYIIPKKVTLKLAYDSVHSYGMGDYTVLNQAALTALGNPTTSVPAQNNDNLDIPSMDSYKVDRISAKVVWNILKSTAMTVGYAYERYKYDDFGYNNYPATYTIKDSSGNVSYLSGAYSNPSYNANIWFLSLSYKF